MGVANENARFVSRSEVEERRNRLSNARAYCLLHGGLFMTHIGCRGGKSLW